MTPPHYPFPPFVFTIFVPSSPFSPLDISVFVFCNPIYLSSFRSLQSLNTPLQFPSESDTFRRQPYYTSGQHRPFRLTSSPTFLAFTPTCPCQLRLRPTSFFVFTSSSSLTSFSFPPRFLVSTSSSFSHFVSVPPRFRLISPSSPPCICPCLAFASCGTPVSTLTPTHFFFLWDACSKEGDRDFATVIPQSYPLLPLSSPLRPLFNPIPPASRGLHLAPESPLSSITLVLLVLLVLLFSLFPSSSLFFSSPCSPRPRPHTSFSFSPRPYFPLTRLPRSFPDHLDPYVYFKRSDTTRATTTNSPVDSHSEPEDSRVLLQLVLLA